MNDICDLPPVEAPPPPRDETWLYVGLVVAACVVIAAAIPLLPVGYALSWVEARSKGTA